MKKGERAKAGPILSAGGKNGAPEQSPPDQLQLSSPEKLLAEFRAKAEADPILLQSSQVRDAVLRADAEQPGYLEEFCEALLAENVSVKKNEFVVYLLGGIDDPERRIGVANQFLQGHPKRTAFADITGMLLERNPKAILSHYQHYPIGAERRGAVKRYFLRELSSGQELSERLGELGPIDEDARRDAVFGLSVAIRRALEAGKIEKAELREDLAGWDKDIRIAVESHIFDN